MFLLTLLAIEGAVGMEICEYWNLQNRLHEHPECMEVIPKEALASPHDPIPLKEFTRKSHRPAKKLELRGACVEKEVWACRDCEPTCNNQAPLCDRTQCLKGRKCFSCRFVQSGCYHETSLLAADGEQRLEGADESELLLSSCIALLRPVIKGEQDNTAEFGEKVKIDLSASVEHAVQDEFIEVTCDSTGLMTRNVYKFHYHNLRAKEVNLVGKKILPSTTEYPAVIMLGLDSMSFGNFRRQMKDTYRIMQNMGFQDLSSHVKIGDNTYANWLAILTGKRGTAVKEFTNELPDEWHIWFDEFPMVWKNFSEHGYATLFAEDRPDIGTFNYFGELNGFKRAPTDHYFRSYWLAAFWSLVGLRSKPFCYDGTPKHEIQLDYLQSFIKEYHGKRSFVFWWNQDMSHDYLNAIGQTDHSYAMTMAIDTIRYAKR
ncbi:unnamed protein product, partial [Mesorhabditis spiculigera]